MQFCGTMYMNKFTRSSNLIHRTFRNNHFLLAEMGSCKWDMVVGIFVNTFTEGNPPLKGEDTHTNIHTTNFQGPPLSHSLTHLSFKTNKVKCSHGITNFLALYPDLHAGLQV